ncbi:carboxypeptidase regulatory-like domain-containing protein [Candidatus Wolfebacteria bacterium]|nr:carboxypeptidase regulatory-like domain-containing protein [Candidatus Wolfebacteria bacterium]
MSKNNKRSLRLFFVFALAGAVVWQALVGSSANAFSIRAVVSQDPTFLAILFDANVSSTLATSSMVTMSTGTVLSVNVPLDAPSVLFVNATGTVGVGETVTVNSLLKDTGGNALATTTATVLRGVKIAAVRAGTTSNALDEYVMLYNTTMNPMTASGTLYLHSVRAGADVVFPLTFATSSIKGRGFFLIASGQGYSGTTPPDATYSTSTDLIATATTTVYISTTSTPTTAIIDKVEWASAAQFSTSTGTGTTNSTSTWAATTVSASLPAGQVVMRKAANASASSTMASGGADSNKGNTYDTRSNSADFVVLDPAAGQGSIIKNSQSPAEFPFGGGQSDTTRPTVTNSFPNGAPGEMVPTDLSFIGFDFSKPVNPSTVTSSTVSLVVQGQSTNLCSTVSYISGGMPPGQCRPASALVAGTTYVFTINGSSTSPNVQDFSNNPLTQPAGSNPGQHGNASSSYQITFSPQSGFSFTPTVPPQVMNTFPNSGANGIATNLANVSLTFSQAMASSSFGAVTLVTGAGSNLLVNASSSLSPDGMTVTIPISTSLATGTTYMATVPTSVRNSNNVALPTAYTTSFVTGNASDSTGPLVLGRLPNITTGVPVNAIDIHVTTDDALDPSTVGTTTVKVTDASSNIVPGTVSYNPTMKEIVWVGTNVFLPSTQYTVTINATGTTPAVKNVANLNLQDSDGSVNALYQFTFTTAATGDSTGPTVVFANANSFSVAVTFSESVKKSEAENIANYTLVAGGNPVTLSALNNNTVTYNATTRTATINNVSLTAAAAFSVTVANVRDLSNNLIGSPSSAGGTVQSGTTGGGVIGPGGGFVAPTGDAPTGFSGGTFGFVPQPEVRPFNTLAGFTSTYGIGLPIATQIPASGKVTLVFPAAFTVAGAAADSFSPANSDINGPGTGAVVISSVVGDDTAHTVTVTLGAVPTQSNSGDTHDFLRFDLSGIVNPPTPSSNYTVDFRTGTATTTLESATSRPFAIGGGSSGSNVGNLTVTVNASGATAGTAAVYLFSPQTGPISSSTSAFAGGTATSTFGSLPNGEYQLATDPIVNLTGGIFIGQAVPTSVTINGTSTKTLTLSTTGSSASSTVNIQSDTAGRKIDIFAGGPQGFVAIATTTINGTSTVTIFYPGNGDYTVGVGPQMPKTFAGPPPSPDYIMPRPVQINVASGLASSRTINFSLTAAGNTMTGVVKDASDKLIAGANVFAYSPQGGFGTFGQSGSDGSFRLSVSSGSYKVGASSPGFPPSQEVSVVVNASGHLFLNGATASTTSVVLKLTKPGRKISGSVTDGTNPVSGAQVWAYCDPGTSGNTCFGPNGHADAQTNSAGAYTLYVGAGTWKVGAFIPGYGQQPEVTSVVGSSDVTLSDFRPSATGSFNSVAGTVCTGNNADCTGGTGVAGAMVRIEGTDPNGKFYSNGTVSGSDGTYSFASIPSGAGSSYRVRGFAPTLGELPATAAFTVTGNVASKDLVVKAGRTVNVFISGAPSSFNAMVGFKNTTSGVGNFIGFRNNASGTVQVSNGAIYAVDARSPGFSLGAATIAKTSGTATYSTSTGQLDLTAGSDTVVLTLTWPATTVISGTVRDALAAAVPSAWIDVSDSTNGFHFGAQANASGVYSLAVADGSYTMNAFSPGYVPVPKTLSISSGTITFGNTTTTASAVNPTTTRTSLAITGTVTVASSTASGAFVKGVLQGGGATVTIAGADGTYSLPVSSGVWTISAGAAGYQSATSSNPVTITDSSVSGVNINLITTVTLAAPAIQSIVPTQGGTIRDSGGKMEVRVPANALGSSANTGQIKATETNTYGATGTARPVGNGQDIRAYDSSNNAITTLNDSVDITLNVASSTFAASSITGTSTAAKLKLAYFDTSLGDWVQVAATLAYEDAAGAPVTPNATLSNVDHIDLTGKSSHFTVFGAILVTDSVAPSPPTGASATGGTANVTVSWTAPTTNSDASSLTDLMEYEIYRDTDANGSFATQVNSSQVASTTTSFSDTSASVGTTYYYKVTATDTSGNESSKSSATIGAQRVSGSSVTTPTGGGGGGGGAGGGAAPTTAQTTTTTTSTTQTTTQTIQQAVPQPVGQVLGGGAQTIVQAPQISGLPQGFSFAKRLMRGARNVDVRNLQQVLSQTLGLDPDDIVTGYFGPITKKAVQEFQEQYGIARQGDPGYGDVGPKTQAKLNQLIAGVAPAAARAEERAQGVGLGLGNLPPGIVLVRNLRIGMKSDDVRNVQQVLARDLALDPQDIATGYFGPITKKAVQDFQEKYGIARQGDPGYGDVGPKTRAKLNELISDGQMLEQPVTTSPPLIGANAPSPAILKALEDQVLDLTRQLQELLRARGVR